MNVAEVLRYTALLMALGINDSAIAQPRVTEGAITDERGMSLYWWSNDVAGSGKSVCTGPCTLSWPPMIAKEGAVPSGDFSLITREDGARQWAHKGDPCICG